MKGTKRLAVLAMFTAIALTIFVAEAQIPPVVPIPGVKLGLANIVTLIAMALLGRRQAGEILLVRIVLGSVFTGGVSAMLFSIAGGVLAYLVMCLTIRRLPERLLWVVSAGSTNPCSSRTTPPGSCWSPSGSRARRPFWCMRPRSSRRA